MKKILLSTAVVALCAGSSFAQQKTTQSANSKMETTVSRRAMIKARMQEMSPEKIAQIRTGRLNKMVGLTSDQTEKVNEIYLEAAKHSKEQMDERQDTYKKIESVLTDEQLKKLNSMRKERMEKMRTMRNMHMQQQPPSSDK